LFFHEVFTPSSKSQNFGVFGGLDALEQNQMRKVFRFSRYLGFEDYKSRNLETLELGFLDKLKNPTELLKIFNL
jgi:hypothetical protein